MNQRIRILIADDQQSARNGLKALLTLYPEFEVVGLASDGREAVQMVEEYRPDVILMDIQMPAMDGLEATRLVKDKWPMIKVIALAMYIGGKDEALTAGVDAYLLKGFEAEILYKTILRILSRSFSNLVVVRGVGRRNKRRSSLHQE
jgi:DNA-binding NarL/FixJ family response regulator